MEAGIKEKGILQSHGGFYKTAVNRTRTVQDALSGPGKGQKKFLCFAQKFF